MRCCGGTPNFGHFSEQQKGGTARETTGYVLPVRRHIGQRDCNNRNFTWRMLLRCHAKTKESFEISVSYLLNSSWFMGC